MSVPSWQTKLLDKWREDGCKTLQQRRAEMDAAAARVEAERVAADERFYAKYPHLRPTAERMAALQAGKCAHCSARLEHVGHFYCSALCAGQVIAAAAST